MSDATDQNRDQERFRLRRAERAQTEWSALVKEPLTVESISGVLYAFGSELACLRLYYKMKPRGRVAYSEPRQSWYYVNE